MLTKDTSERIQAKAERLTIQFQSSCYLETAGMDKIFVPYYNRFKYLAWQDQGYLRSPTRTEYILVVSTQTKAFLLPKLVKVDYKKPKCFRHCLTFGEPYANGQTQGPLYRFKDTESDFQMKDLIRAGKKCSY